MKKDNIIYRKFPEGDIIALFPDKKWNTCNDHNLIMSYQHIGQHGGASRELITELAIPTNEETKELSEELKSIGYKI